MRRIAKERIEATMDGRIIAVADKSIEEEEKAFCCLVITRPLDISPMKKNFIHPLQNNGIDSRPTMVKVCLTRDSESRKGGLSSRISTYAATFTLARTTVRPREVVSKSQGNSAVTCPGRSSTFPPYQLYVIEPKTCHTVSS